MTRRETTKIIKTFFVLLALVILFGYAGFRAKDFVIGPVLEVNNPKNGTSVEESLVEITGSAKNISFLTLNGNKIFINEEGVFREKILLSYGYNIISVEAKDRFGRTENKIIQLVYK